MQLPPPSLQVYVEDSLGDRVWVDLDQCKNLVDNICTLFQTRPNTPAGAPSTKSVGSEGVRSVGGDGGGAGEEGGGVEEVESEGLSSVDVEVKSRFDKIRVVQLGEATPTYIMPHPQVLSSYCSCATYPRDTGGQ